MLPRPDSEIWPRWILFLRFGIIAIRPLQQQFNFSLWRAVNAFLGTMLGMENGYYTRLFKLQWLSLRWLKKTWLVVLLYLSRHTFTVKSFRGKKVTINTREHHQIVANMMFQPPSQVISWRLTLLSWQRDEMRCAGLVIIFTLFTKAHQCWRHHG